MIKIIKKISLIGIILIILGIFILIAINWRVSSYGGKFILSLEEVPEAEAIMVLGAYVDEEGKVCNMLEDRLNYSLKLYHNNKGKKLLLSGDHGQKDYDEVNAMKSFVEEKNVDGENIFLDHAGFSTYESMYRARDVFKAKKIIVVTQDYHLRRAIYIARKLGIEAYGVASDPRDYYGMEYYKKREVAARIKDFLLVNVLKSKPTYLGETIPVTGDGRVTHDK